MGRNEATLLAPTSNSTPPLPATIPRAEPGAVCSSHSGKRSRIEEAHSFFASVLLFGEGNLDISAGYVMPISPCVLGKHTLGT